MSSSSTPVTGVLFLKYYSSQKCSPFSDLYASCRALWLLLFPRVLLDQSPGMNKPTPTKNSPAMEILPEPVFLPGTVPRSILQFRFEGRSGDQYPVFSANFSVLFPTVDLACADGEISDDRTSPDTGHSIGERLPVHRRPTSYNRYYTMAYSAKSPAVDQAFSDRESITFPPYPLER